MHDQTHSGGTPTSRRSFFTTGAAAAGATILGATQGPSADAAATREASSSGEVELKEVVARPDLYFYPGEELADDEIRVTILGSGWGNIVRRAQAACSIFIEIGNGDSFVFDMGQGTFVNYNSLNIPYSRMTKVFITHLHMDHMTDLAALYCFGPATGDRFTPLELWGPSGQKPELGMRSVIDGLKQFTKWHTVSFETAVPVDRSYELEVHELDYRQNPGVAYEKNGVTIKHWPALHVIDGAISYRLDWNGMSVVWSGDTNPNHFFVEHAKGADLLIHETAPTAARLVQANNVPKKIADNIIAASHTPARAYGKVLSLTKPSLAVTNHCPIDPQEITDFVREVGVHWNGPYQIGEDFMVFNVSKSKNQITVRQAAVNERSWTPNVQKATGTLPLNPADYRSQAIFGQEIKDY
jgi:ribonuclease Z